MRERGGQGPGSGFRLLMERLDRDPVRADAAFLRLRRSLVKYFDWRGAPWPEDGADETLERLAHKLEEPVAVLDVTAFARGIARLVLQEQGRSREHEKPLDEKDARTAAPPAGPDGEEPLRLALDHCLEGLPKGARDLVLAYYGGGSGRAKIEGRRRLARDQRLSDNALRSRVQRLRDDLEGCVRSKVDARDGGKR